MNATTKTLMEAGRTYSIRLITPEGKIPIMTLRTITSNKADLAQAWVRKDLVQEKEDQIDVGDAWLTLCHADDREDMEIAHCLCAWCFPGAGKDNGDSHGICDACQIELLKGLPHG